MLELYKKINYSTFESGNIDNATCMIEGTINGEDVSIMFDDKENYGTAMSAIKGLFARAESETFLSALSWVDTYLLTKQNPHNDDPADRIPLEDQEVESLRFSYEQVKETGKDVSPAVTYAQLLDKVAIAEIFDLTESAQRKRQTPKDKNVAIW